VFRQRVAQFNGCVPYAGVSTATRVDEAVLPVLFALLPVPQPVGITVAPPSVKVRVRHSNLRSYLDLPGDGLEMPCASVSYLHDVSRTLRSLQLAAL